MLHEALPFVSVIMPLYNQVNYVRQALDSVLLQNCPKLELLVIDDGSDDGSADIVREFIDEGNNFVRLIQQPNSGGPAQPRNRGIVESKGSLIAFLDPDDFWLPGKLLHQVEVLQAAPDVAMVFSDAYLIDSVGTILDRYLKRVSYRKRAEKFLIPFERNDTFLTCEGFYVFSSVEVAGPQTSGVIVRRNALDAESECFASYFRVGEDLDLWFRLMEKRRCIFIDLPLHAYRQHAASLMHQGAEMLAGSALCHGRNFIRVQSRLKADDAVRYRRRIAELHASAGWNDWHQNRVLVAREDYRQALHWVVRWKYIRGWLQTWIPVWFLRIFPR
ncbi:MAG: glycosyltransferase family 2 protein [Betaproteobacteria bacterium]|nr:glycosyltransferase family 2 protein [Betaproteobacteria bacterium]